MIRRIAVSCGLTAWYLVATMGYAVAADHIDAPLVREDARKDVTDLHVFRNPADSSRLVIALSLFTPVGAPDSVQLFDPETAGEYAIFIDTDGDQVEEHTIRATFDAGAGGDQRYTIEGIPGTGTITGSVTASGEAIEVSSARGAQTFAGLRDDPFFFDSEAFNSFLAGPCIPAAGLRCPGTGSPSNFFGDFDVAAIVVEFPLTALDGISSADSGRVAVWGETFSK